MIYTGSWFAMKKVKIKKIRISLSVPKGHRYDMAIPALYPTWPMLKMGKEEYGKKYDEILRKADKAGIIEDIIKMGEKEDIVLLCWEKSWDNCHRKRVAEYIKNKYNINVEEYSGGSSKSKDTQFCAEKLLVAPAPPSNQLELSW